MKKLLASDEEKKAAANVVATTKGTFWLELKRYKAGKTNAQLGLLWGVWYPAIKEHLFDNTGLAFTCDQIHDDFKDRFLPPIVSQDIDGNIKHYKPRVSKLDKKEMSDYMNKIDMYCADSLGLDLPIPDQYGWNGE